MRKIPSRCFFWKYKFQIKAFVEGENIDSGLDSLAVSELVILEGSGENHDDCSACCVEELSVPENGLTWVQIKDTNRWELKCKINYEIEKGFMKLFT